MVKRVTGVLLAVFLMAGVAHAISLSKNCDKLAKELLKGLSKESAKIYLDPQGFRGEDGMVHPLSWVLRDELAVAFTKSGEIVASSEEEAEYVVTGRYYPQGDKLVINCRIAKRTPSTYQVVRFARREVPLKEIKPLLRLDLSVFARIAVDRLVNQLRKHGTTKVILIPSPFRLEGKPLYPKFSYLFLEEIKGALSHYPWVELVESDALSRSVRGLRRFAKGRGIAVLPPKGSKEGKIWTKGSLLTGTLWPDKDGVRIFVKVVGQGKKVLASSQVRIPETLVPPSALKIQESKAMPVVSLEGSGLDVTIMPDRGEGASYTPRDRLTFVIRVNKKAFVHIYDYDPKGRVMLLYPCRRERGLLEPGKIYFLPREEEWKVAPPYGADRVFVFASTEPLTMPFPADCGDRLSLDLKELFTHYRSQKTPGGYAEAVATVVTKSK